MTAGPRLSTQTWVSALLRRVHVAGDSALILKRGEATAGAVLVLEQARNGRVRLFQRAIGPDGEPAWVVAVELKPQQPEENAYEQVDRYVVKQRQYDPDLWVVELMTEDATRFIADPGSND